MLTVQVVLLVPTSLGMSPGVWWAARPCSGAPLAAGLCQP